MTISANGRAAASDLLERSLELYRDLSVALGERIAKFKLGGAGEDDDCRTQVDAVKDYHRALQTVLDLEASLGKRRKAWVDGTCVELDLAAARDEIRKRLAGWLA
jgi:hypothetical protein